MDSDSAPPPFPPLTTPTPTPTTTTTTTTTTTITTTTATTVTWSNLVKQQSEPNKQQYPRTAVPAASQIFDSFLNSSSKGISFAVIDANAIIQGGERLTSLADKLVTIEEVIHEIRDPTSRHRLSVLPFEPVIMDPSPEDLNKVISFARATGDLQTLSEIDLKLIALAYTLEARYEGTSHLRDTPPPVHMLNVRRLPEKDMPGWGSNVSNLEEWEALEGLPESNSNQESKILPLRDLSLNLQPDENASLHDVPVESHPLDDNHTEESPRRHRRYPPKKREVKIEGKMVADGVDASLGQCNEDEGDWCPAVSRSTYRRYVRRQARREMNKTSLKNDDKIDVEGKSEQETQNSDGKNDSEDISSMVNKMKLENEADHEEIASGLENLDLAGERTDSLVEDVETDQHFDSSVSHVSEDITASYVDDNSSEQSGLVRPLSDSCVACMTADYAMQNVILQMGLRLIAPGGMQIRELHRWVLKCHACHMVTDEIGRIFCPRCGNGGTLRKVALTVGQNGIVLAARRPRVILRGTRFSLPLPQGGRDGLSKNPVLREDQLPKKYGVFLRGDQRSKNKKKSSDNGEGSFFVPGEIFGQRANSKGPVKPPVKQALSMFWGKRNPNDNHYSRSRG